MAARRRITRRQPAQRKKRRRGKGVLAGWLRRAADLLGNGWLMVTAGAAVGVVAIVLISGEQQGSDGRPALPAKPSQTATAPALSLAAPPVASPVPAAPPAAAPAMEPAAAARTAPALAALPAPPPAVEAGPPAWRRNAVAVPDTGSRPRIAVVIDDLGLNRVNTAKVSDLPGPLTLAFLTYAGDLRRQAAAARRAGHELMVHMAMEPMAEDIDPGPDVLRITEPPAQMMAQLRHNLDAFDGYVGINNHMGSRFTASEPDMRLVLAELRNRGLLFLDSRTIANSVGATVAAQLGVPFAERDVFLDNDQSADAVGARLAEVERIARSRGQAVAIGHPHDATIAALAAWLPTLEARGFALVPISAIVKRRLGETG